MTAERAIDLMPRFTERLSFARFLSMPQDLRNMIRSVSIIPPTLGTRDFGGVVVEYSSPVYAVHQRRAPRPRRR